MANFANLKNFHPRDGQLHKSISQKQVPEFLKFFIYLLILVLFLLNQLSNLTAKLTSIFKSRFCVKLEPVQSYQNFNKIVISRWKYVGSKSDVLQNFTTISYQ